MMYIDMFDVMSWLGRLSIAVAEPVKTGSSGPLLFQRNVDMGQGVQQTHST